MGGAEVLVAESSESPAAAAHNAAALACEKAIEAILANRATPTPENDWAEVVATDAAWNATETAWRLSREAGYALELARHAVNAVEASQLEESGSDRAIAWLRVAIGSHRAAETAHRANS